jgi:hypothetical protein
MRVLTVWASLNTAISYRQGMHELLAPIVKVTTSSRSWTLGSESTNTHTHTYLVRRYLFADSTQTLFSVRMISQVLQRDIEALERDNSSRGDDEDARNIEALLQVKENTARPLNLNPKPQTAPPAHTHAF